MVSRRASAKLAVALAAVGILVAGPSDAQTLSKLQVVDQGPVRYPPYPVAKRIEPIVPPRAVAAAAIVRKGVTTASVPRKIAAPKSASAKSAATLAPLPGKSALGAPLPPVKAVKAKAKPGTAQR